MMNGGRGYGAGGAGRSGQHSQEGFRASAS